MPKPTTVRFVVELTASAPFHITFASHDIEQRLKDLPLTGSGLYDRPVLTEWKVRSYNSVHRRKLLQPAKYSERE